MKTDANLTNLSRTGALQEDVSLRVTEVLEEYLSDLERGVAPSRQELLAQHPR